MLELDFLVIDTPSGRPYEAKHLFQVNVINSFETRLQVNFIGLKIINFVSLTQKK